MKFERQLKDQLKASFNPLVDVVISNEYMLKYKDQEQHYLPVSQ